MDEMKQVESGGAPPAKKPALPVKTDERKRGEDRSRDPAKTEGREASRRSPAGRDEKGARPKENIKPLFPIREWDRDKMRQSRSGSRGKAVSGDRAGRQNRGDRDVVREERRRRHDDSREGREGSKRGKFIEMFLEING